MNHQKALLHEAAHANIVELCQQFEVVVIVHAIVLLFCTFYRLLVVEFDSRTHHPDDSIYQHLYE